MQPITLTWTPATFLLGVGLTALALASIVWGARRPLYLGGDERGQVSLRDRHALGAFVLLTGMLVAVEVARGYLPAWWFRTDACPTDPNITCGQAPPIALLIVIPLFLVWVALSWWGPDDSGGGGGG